MLLSKLEPGKKKKRGGQKREQLPVSKGAVMFAIFKSIGFLFWVFDVCRCASLKTL